MENKQATTAISKPLGMCEKLFIAFQPTLQPLRRLTFRQQEATAALAQGKAQPAKDKNPKPKAQEKPLPYPAPPKAEIRPLGAVPQPQPPPPPMAEVQKPKKGINEKVEDYISRTKGKIRIGSGDGRVPSSKMK